MPQGELTVPLEASHFWFLKPIKLNGYPQQKGGLTMKGNIRICSGTIFLVRGSHMISKRCLLIVLVFLSSMLFFIAGPAFSSPNITDCQALKGYVETLKDVTFHKPVTNVTAVWTDATATTASFCQVTGWMWPEIKFQVTLPTNWNKRYVMDGGGGWDGSLNIPTAPDPDGYARSSANGGYMAANWPTDAGALAAYWPNGAGSFGLKEPYFSKYYDPTKYPTGAGGWYGDTNPIGSGNPDACQKVVDFGIRHLMETPIIAKKIIHKYYHNMPKYSYYNGSSCGGKEGQISAQKFPEFYNGFYIGCPLGGHLAVTFRGTWDDYWSTKSHLSDLVPGCPYPPFLSLFCPTVYSTYKAQAHHDAVYNKCDGVDGLVDGLIDDPRKCNFDAVTDLPACDPAEEAAENAGDFSSPKAYQCFTLAQRQAIKEIYAGPHNSHGKPWYPGQPIGSEYIGLSLFGGIGSGFVFAINDWMAPGMFADIALDPPKGPTFDITKFNWDKDPIAMQQTVCTQCYDGNDCQWFNVHDTLDGITISPKPAPNMGGFEPVYREGAKIVQVHGWGDSLVTALAASVGLYETLFDTMGVEKTKSFYKLYLVPGAGHCGGGVGAWPSNGFQAMVDWVEKGKEPAALIGTATYPNLRTRPICPYPEVARWNGSSANGGIDNADNFSCVPPVNVKIEPERLNLNSKGVFTATLSVPEDYDIRDWNIQGVSCEGANAVSGTIARNTYIAKFNRQDLKNVSTGDVMFTVEFSFNPTGRMKALTQGTDMVRVIK